jgi:hypothetical protein
MCHGCWVGNYGAPIVNTEDVLVTAELIRRLYEDLECPTGGPLHAMLDDMNIADEQVENEDVDRACEYLFDGSFERYAQAGDDTSDERKNAIKETCRMIIWSFRQMPESHRAAAIAYHEGWVPEGIFPRTVSADQVAEWTADLAAIWARGASAPQPQPGGQKACVSIPCPPFTGVVYPPSGTRFAQDARITGPGVAGVQVNPDGSATVQWRPRPAITAEDIQVANALTASAREVMDDPRQIRPTYPDRSDGTLPTSATSPLMADIKARILDPDLRKLGLDPHRYELAYRIDDLPATVPGPTATPERNDTIRKLGEALDVPPEILAGLTHEANRIETD